MIEALSVFASRWGGFLLLAVIQNTVFLGLVFVILRMMRRASARARYLVAAAGLMKLFIPPFLSFPRIAAPAVATISGYGGLMPFVASSPGGPAAGAAESGGATSAGLLLGAWAAVTAAYLLIITASSLRLAIGLRGAERVPEAQLPDIPGIARLSVLITERAAIPMTLAFFPGRIYVPPAWERWSADCRRMVLLHEMAHLRRRDGLVLVFQMIARAAYFFHPLVVLLDHRMSEYREMACDDATVGRDRRSSVKYSRYLVEIAESLMRSPAVCVSASALIRRRNELLKRVSYQLEEGRMRYFSRTRIMILAAAVALLAVSLSWHRGDAAAGSDYPSPPQPPRPPARQSGSETKPVNVLLRSDGMDINGEAVAVQELSRVLLGFAGEDPSGVLINLTCADDVPMENVRYLHKVLTDGGIDKIRYVNSGGEGQPLQLPPPKALERLGEMPADMIIDVTVGASGEVAVGTRKVKPEELADAVRKRLEASPLAVVVINNESETRYGDFVRILGLVREAGAERIAIKFTGDQE